MSKTKSTPGIEEVHRQACASHKGKRCSCPDGPSYMAMVFDKYEKKKIRKTFSTRIAAEQWRVDQRKALRLAPPEPIEEAPTRTVREACASWVTEAHNGIVTTRSGDQYKPGAIRSYEQSLKLRVLDRKVNMSVNGKAGMIAFGDAPMHEVKRLHVQRLVDSIKTDVSSAGERVSPATVMGALTALRVVVNREIITGQIEVDPISKIKMDAVRSKRDRYATPQEAVALLAALPEEDRATWATAFYAGLRRGEVMGLRWQDIDLKAGIIEVNVSWDPEHGPQTPKNGKSRKVPIPSVLREYLLAEKMRQSPGVELVFGTTSTRPFSPTRLVERADAAWTAAELTRIGMHECRHTYASFMIGANVNAKALCDFMGHASITTTLNLYGHLMPGAHGEAADLLDAYLARAADAEHH